MSATLKHWRPWLAEPDVDAALDVHALSFRGRGLSDRDPNHLNYHPSVYVQDVITMAEHLDITRAVFIGTSLGGIVTMLMAVEKPGLLAGAILNDIGPDLAPEGVARIAGYVGGSAEFETWQAAAEALKAINAVAFPAYREDATFWLAFAKRCCREERGKVLLDYDPKVAAALAEAGPAPDLWPAFESFSCPVLAIRGAISDLYTEEIEANMKQRLPQLQTAVVPDTGHAPTLDEPAARQAIQQFITAL